MRRILFLIFSIFVFIIYISCLVTFITYSNYSFSTSATEFYFSNSEFSWPLPGYSEISSGFGLRSSPTSGASSFHSGIDIPAPEGTKIFSSTSGKVVYIDFNGANGYTIMIENNNMIFSYSHISPDFIVSAGDNIRKNQHIANVGPKYVSGIQNNPYKDSSRTSNKWCDNWNSSTF